MNTRPDLLETVELVIRNRIEDLAQVTDVLDDLGERHRLPPSALSMHLCLDEILSNIVKYAHAEGAEHPIRIRLLIARESIQAEVEDEGHPFDPLSAPEQNMPASPSEVAIGGQGIRLVRRLMTNVRYARIGGRNRLTLTKQFTE